jgi:hypothetical protein
VCLGRGGWGLQRLLGHPQRYDAPTDAAARSCALCGRARNLLQP